MRPDLDDWVPRAGVQVLHARHSRASADALWSAARALPLSQTGRLGRLVRWRIPGLPREITVGDLFSQPPFMVLESGDRALVSGLVGRIWTLRRDYPRLQSAEEFRDWNRSGTARVVFAHWVEADEDGAILSSEARVEPLGNRGRMGLAAVKPLVRAFQPLVGSDGITAAVRAAERDPGDGATSRGAGEGSPGRGAGESSSNRSAG